MVVVPEVHVTKTAVAVLGVHVTKAVTKVVTKVLKLNVVAEGVETQEQQELLQEEHCERLQGHYFAHPNTVDSLLNTVRGINVASNTDNVVSLTGGSTSKFGT